MKEKLNIIQEGLAFDDVLLQPNFSHIHPRDVNVSLQLTPRIKLKIPLISSAMDTVTEAKLAIALAQLGGLGIIHKNMSISDQSKHVSDVKKLPLKNLKKFPDAAIDKKGCLIVGAAIGITDNALERVKSLIDSGVDILCVDSAHGHSKRVIDLIASIRKKFPTIEMIAGNVATGAGALALYNAGANVIKVGIGPGSICTTRVVTGVGVPQISAIMNVYAALKNKKVKIIADGGIKFSGDITKALAAGADVVMLGSAFAGVEESPGDVIELQGYKYKSYRGMGSLGAMSAGSNDRYFQDTKNVMKLVPEGVEGLVVFKGKLEEVVFQMIGGLRSGMGYSGAADINTLKKTAQFVKISNAGLNESHPHQVLITHDSPNYKRKLYS
ncbi:MAG: IMP dehydrogenase [Sediminibacterium sp.]|nr:IMP dehydrogenase [Sediminibacterium sp.]